LKKYILVLIFTIISSSVFPGTLDLTGKDWVEMNENQKAWFIAGMFMGFDIIRTAIDESPIDNEVEDMYGLTIDVYFQYLHDHFNLGVNVATIVSDLDDFYRTEENINYYIWSSIMTIYKKAWW